MKNFIVLILACFMTTGIFAQIDCAGKVIQSIDPSTSTITFSEATKLYTLKNGQSKYSSAMKGCGPNTIERAWLNTKTPAPDGKPTIALEVGKQTACTSDVMQKVNFHFLYKQNESGLSFKVRRFIGFNMMVDSDSELLKTWAIVFQLWQGSPHSPPFAAKLVKDSIGVGVKLVFEVKNNTTRSNPSSVPIKIGEIPDFQYGVWYQFVLELLPYHEALPVPNPLVTTIGISYKKYTDPQYETISYQGMWGYDPTNKVSCPYAGDCTKLPNPTIDFKFGPYRQSENTRLTVLYGAIRMATCFECVDPSLQNK